MVIVAFINLITVQATLTTVHHVSHILFDIRRYPSQIKPQQFRWSYFHNQQHQRQMHHKPTTIRSQSECKLNSAAKLNCIWLIIGCCWVIKGVSSLNNIEDCEASMESGSGVSSWVAAGCASSFIDNTMRFIISWSSWSRAKSARMSLTTCCVGVDVDVVGVVSVDVVVVVDGIANNDATASRTSSHALLTCVSELKIMFVK